MYIKVNTFYKLPLIYETPNPVSAQKIRITIKFSLVQYFVRDNQFFTTNFSNGTAPKTKIRERESCFDG